MEIEFIIDKNEYMSLLKDEIKNDLINYESKKVKGKNNYILKMNLEGNNVTNAKILSANRKILEELFEENKIKYRLLTEEASQYYLKKLYPLACEFETKHLYSCIVRY